MEVPNLFGAIEWCMRWLDLFVAWLANHQSEIGSSNGLDWWLYWLGLVDPILNIKTRPMEVPNLFGAIEWCMC